MCHHTIWRSHLLLHMLVAYIFLDSKFFSLIIHAMNKVYRRSCHRNQEGSVEGQKRRGYHQLENECQKGDIVDPVENLVITNEAATMKARLSPLKNYSQKSVTNCIEYSFCVFIWFLRHYNFHIWCCSIIVNKVVDSWGIFRLLV